MSFTFLEYGFVIFEMASIKQSQATMKNALAVAVQWVLSTAYPAISNRIFLVGETGNNSRA